MSTLLSFIQRVLPREQREPEKVRCVIFENSLKIQNPYLYLISTNKKRKEVRRVQCSRLVRISDVLYQVFYIRRFISGILYADSKKTPKTFIQEINQTA